MNVKQQRAELCVTALVLALTDYSIGQRHTTQNLVFGFSIVGAALVWVGARYLCIKDQLMGNEEMPKEAGVVTIMAHPLIMPFILLLIPVMQKYAFTPVFFRSGSMILAACLAALVVSIRPISVRDGLSRLWFVAAFGIPAIYCAYFGVSGCLSFIDLSLALASLTKIILDYLQVSFGREELKPRDDSA